MKIDLKNKASQWFVLIILAVIWGSSFILMKKGLLTLTSIKVAAFRIFFAFLVLAPMGFHQLKKIKPKNIFPIFWVGFFGNFIPAFLFAYAQTELSSSLTGMLNSLVPFFTLVLGVLLFKAKAKSLNIIGVVLGLLGALGLVYTTSNGLKVDGNLMYSLMPIVATICYASSVNTIKYYLGDLSPLTITVVAFTLVGPFAIAFLLYDGFALNGFQNFLSVGVLYVALLGIVGTAMAVLLFNALIKQTTALFASSVTYLIPVVAIFWGVLDGEAITLIQALFLGLILGGVYLVRE